MSYQTYANKPGNPIWRIIEHLQRNGPATIKELETLLGVTTTAVRQHLQTLQSDGYIERTRVRTGVGRPHHVYATTQAANELFACHCDDLALTLLEEVFAMEGSVKTTRLLDRVGERLANRYSPSVRSTILRERVDEMAVALNQKGVLTDVNSEQNAVVLQTYNCPYHELAQEHREICEMDEKMMGQALGTDVNLSSCMMDGHSCCSFSVGPAGVDAS